jgi:glycosyltransferase involved in cell wall biosynthesis
MASVSVVIPTYNGAAFVEQALASVFAQTVRPQEIIVVDDCSSDDTRTIVAQIARTSPVPLRLLSTNENSGGPARPLNQGIAVAAGEFIAVLDQDDVFVPTKLEDQVPCLARDKTVSFVFSLCAQFDSPARLVAPAPALQALRAALSSAANSTFSGVTFLRLLLAQGNFLIGYPAVLFRRRRGLSRGGVNENLVIASDYEFFCGLCLQGNVAFLDRVHYLRRSHAANLCWRQEQMRIEACRVRALYQARQPQVLEDAGVSSVLRQSLFDLGFMLRQRGAYREAMRQHWQSLRTWGWDRRTLAAMLKMIPHWARRKLRGAESCS